MLIDSPRIGESFYFIDYFSTLKGFYKGGLSPIDLVLAQEN